MTLDQRRADTAEKLEKRLDRLWKATDKIPSFKGKAPFMDKVLAARNEAHSLAWDLRLDVNEKASQ